nr:MAG TPA: hypothetical protein [Caudoviricetes sp.]
MFHISLYFRLSLPCLTICLYFLNICYSICI